MRLLLEDLTQEGFQLYVHEKLEVDARYFKLAREDPRCGDLARQIKVNAHGVFLWLRLVVAELLRGLRNDDPILELQLRLRFIPSSLETYYHRMLDSITEFYRRKASQLLLVSMEAVRPLSVFAVTFLQAENKAMKYVLESESKDFQISASS